MAMTPTFYLSQKSSGLHKLKKGPWRILMYMKTTSLLSRLTITLFESLRLLNSKSVRLWLVLKLKQIVVLTIQWYFHCRDIARGWLVILTHDKRFYR